MTDKPKKALIIGESGQLAWELLRATPETVQATAVGSGSLGAVTQAAVHRVVSRFEPDIIINAAAYTAVDNAEADEERANTLNNTLVKLLAEEARSLGFVFVHVSTDFVFDGKSSRPYAPGDSTAPLGIYGATKLAGEKSLISSGAGRSAIVRTSWLYSSHGSNFVKTMLGLMREKNELRVVSDQVGSPTWAKGLAVSLWRAALRLAIDEPAGPASIHHWSDSGVASWYDFAVAIQEFALEMGLLDKKIPILPIGASEFPTAASRPHYSVLDKSEFERKFGCQAPHWRSQLKLMMAELAAGVADSQKGRK